MALPQRHRRNINCAGRAYHWHFPQGRAGDHRADLQLIVQAANGQGQVLKVCQESWSEITPAFVAAAIAEAIDSGWRPEEPGRPFTLARPAAGPPGDQRSGKLEAGAGDSAVSLEFTGHTLILFEDHTFRWFSVKRFTLDGIGDDSAVLAALIGSWRYRDTYVTRGSHEQDSGDTHGPYRVTAITPAEFTSVDPIQAAAVVEEFCSLYDTPARSDVRKQVAAVVLSQFAGAACYQLRDLPDARHEWAFVLLGFRELVAICRATGQVLSVVMASD